MNHLLDELLYAILHQDFFPIGHGDNCIRRCFNKFNHVSIHAYRFIVYSGHCNHSYLLRYLITYYRKIYSIINRKYEYGGHRNATFPLGCLCQNRALETGPDVQV